MPRFVHEMRVGAHRINLNPHFLELVVALGEITELRRTDEGEIGRIKEKHRPFSPQIIVSNRLKFSLVIGLQLEFRDLCIDDSVHSFFLLIKDCRPLDSISKIDYHYYVIIFIYRHYRKKNVMPTLIQLQYALAVQNHRHFGQAARACRVTQPTLSQQLQKLEDEVGIILFDRTKKPILPTPEGERFLGQARNVLREHDKLLHVSKQAKSGEVAGDFCLGVIPTVASCFLPMFVPPFSRRFPHVTLYIEELKTETILNDLANDRLDGAILATPVDGIDFKVHPLYYEPFLAYFAAGHELLKSPYISRSQLDPSEMWLLQDGHCFKDQVLNFCSLPLNKESSVSNIHFQSGSLDTLRQLVHKSEGYTLIPALMALALRRDEQLAHVRPFKAPVPTREIGLMYRRGHWKLGILRAIEDTVTEILPKGVFQERQKTYRVLDVSIPKTNP